MIMSKNIEMNYKTESGYEAIYPSVMVDNIGDLESWADENFYDKAEIDNQYGQIGTIKISTVKPSNDWIQCNG